MALAPGQAVTLRYAYGMAHDENVAALVAKYRAQPATRSRPARRAGRDWLPRADFGRSRAWVARELAVGRVPAALRLRVRGALRATHDHPGRLLPVPDRAEPRLPELAALRAADGVRGSRARARDPALLGVVAAGGRAASCRTASGPLCTPVAARDVGDLDFWLLLAAAEYGLGSRDTAFFASRSRSSTRARRRACGST